MDISKAELNLKYKILDIDICESCTYEHNSCHMISLMEKGFVPHSTFSIISKKLGMYELLIDGTHLIMRQSDFDSLNITIENL